jgi:hypothetical protein
MSAPHFFSTLRRLSLSDGVSMSFCTEKSSATRVNFFTLSKARNSLLYCSISSPIFFFTLSFLSISSYEPETPLEPAHLVTESLSGTISATL